MALPASGAINLGDVNVELGVARATSRALGAATTRTLYGVASGAIRLAADGYGKSSAFSGTISSNQTNLNLRSWALSNGWNGTLAAIITINSGVIISGSVEGNSTAALTIDGSWPAGITLVNNGVIVGRGGTGGNGRGATVGTAGGIGGTALTASVAVSINNTGTIAGGGGGGGGAGYTATPGGDTTSYNNGCGGGGGASSSTTAPGGTGGTTSLSFVVGNPGDSGTYNTSGLGGTKTGHASGGNGGTWGASGSAGANGTTTGYAGGAGGRSVNGNSNITWIATGTRLGSIV